MNQRTIAIVLALTVIVCAPVFRATAAVTEQEAQKLKTTLTPLGGERAGNKDGTIPAWTGGYASCPANYRSGDPRPDPFADEKPLYTVTAANLAQYADKLPEGEAYLLKHYPDYKVEVYPTHRTAAAPNFVYENTYQNALRAKTTNGGVTIEGAYGGIPFPIPHDGFEAMWNDTLAWKGINYADKNAAYLKEANGGISLLSKALSQGEFPYYNKNGSLASFDGIYWKASILLTDPPALNGSATLIYSTTDPYSRGQPGWQYLPGQRRVRMAPNLTYDTPDFFASGVGQMDDFNIFNGSLDEYTFKLTGKQEMIVPYNENGVRLTPPEQQFAAHTVNPDHFRWELHRVWVIDATLAAGKRNAVPKRRIYLDEDTWQALAGEEWDASGALWRHLLETTLIVCDAPGTIAWGGITYDFHTGIVASGAVSEPTAKPSFQIVPAGYPADFFTPNDLAARMAR